MNVLLSPVANAFSGDGAAHGPCRGQQGTGLRTVVTRTSRNAREAYQLLAEPELALDWQAACAYLLASIEAARGDHHAALGFYHDARDTYQALQSAINLYKTTLQMARMHAALANFEEAEGYLATAMDHFHADQAGPKEVDNLKEYLIAVQDVALADHDYAKVFESVVKEYRLLEKSEDRDGMAEALIKLGFWYTYFDCPEQGMTYTDHAASLVYYMRDDHKHYLVQINRLLFRRAAGFQIGAGDVLSLREKSRDKKDFSAETYLSLAMGFEPANRSYDCDGLAVILE